MSSEVPKLNCLGVADEPAGRGGGLKWAAILCFAGAPFLSVWTAMLVIPEPPVEPAEKVELFQRRSVVDTVIVGDSRVGRVAEEPFASKGWNYFNMVLSGVSPEDMAMQLKYALTHGKIRRVVMGVSFEGMTARYPFEFSHHYAAGPFTAAEIVGFATVAGGPPLPQSGGIRKFLRSDLLPIERASLRSHWAVARANGRNLSGFLPNGTKAYEAIREQIAAGDYDFARQRDVKIYFNSDYSEPRYLERPELARHALRLYRKVFAALRDAKIACVVFETGRTAEYQRMLDARTELALLQRQWRAFFRAESYGGVKFLDADATRDCYAEDDFFDAVHFIGPTESRLAQRLADELAALENAGAAGPFARPAGTGP